MQVKPDASEAELKKAYRKAADWAMQRVTMTYVTVTRGTVHSTPTAIKAIYSYSSLVQNVPCTTILLFRIIFTGAIMHAKQYPQIHTF
jgi:5,10-methylenetetrahydrofolate reductase